MITAAASVEYTPEDLLRMPDGDRYELVDGKLVERHMGFQAGLVASELLRRLSNHCHEHRLGYVNQGGDGSFQCFPDRPRMVRKPDVSFVRLGRFPQGIPSGHAQIPPDLAVEVVSPNDLYEELDRKVSEYLQAGVRLVWVISPENRTACVYRPDGSARRLFAANEFEGEEVVPGFRCKVGDLFEQLPPAPSGERG